MTAPRVLAEAAVMTMVVILAITIGIWFPHTPGVWHQNETTTLAVSPPPQGDVLSVRFTLCDGPIRVNCVVDGDTFWFRGDKIRIVDIDAPEIFSPRCRSEKQIGEIARDRLLALLNAGGFTLVSGWRDTDRYGRKLRTVTRADRSLGEKLVEEGLAWRWNEPRRDWCALD
ncbi:thermonuclease family protein [Bradyrhizobium sp. Ai1a-2]|uniref:thermonuclease family protein n=1 Tax=Bradyrhizobium sp. Ai1a-2 TaxID=196490 RepID=UPI0004025297|nr:thermonuclease family protein [Bradyrhizobium sp. Ai1a-2]